MKNARVGIGSDIYRITQFGEPTGCHIGRKRLPSGTGLQYARLSGGKIDPTVALSTIQGNFSGQAGTESNARYPPTPIPACLFLILIGKNIRY